MPAAAARPLIRAILVADNASGDIDMLTDADISTIPIEAYVSFNDVHREVCALYEKKDREKRDADAKELIERQQRVAKVLTSTFGDGNVGRFAFDPDETKDGLDRHVKLTYMLRFNINLEKDQPYHEIAGCLRYTAKPTELGGVEYTLDACNPEATVHVTAVIADRLACRNRTCSFFHDLHAAMGVPEGVLKLEGVRQPMMSHI